MLSQSESEQITDYYLFFHKEKGSFRIVNGFLYYAKPEAYSEHKKFKQSNSIVLDKPKDIFLISDCLIRIRSIQRLLESDKFILHFNIIPTSADEFEKEHIITGSTNIYASGNKFTLFSNKILLLARQNGFRIFDEKLFVYFIRGLVDVALNSPRHFDIPYFVTGYNRDERFINFEAVKKFLPYKITDKELTGRHIDNLYKYINARPSAGMLFLYALLAVAHYPLAKVYSDFSNFKTLSLNYCGKKRSVMADVNLFVNFFGSSLITDYSATLDSASYSISKYAVFKDVPLVVRKLREKLSSRNNDLHEILELRYENILGFFPVIISEAPIKLSEVLTICSSNNHSVKKEFWLDCKNSVGLILRTVINNIGNDFEISDQQKDLNINIDDYYCDYDVACFRIMVLTSLDLFDTIIEKYCSCTDLSILLRQILDDFTLDKNLMLFPPTEYLPSLDPDSFQNKVISKVLDFIRNTYYAHKDDNPQKTVFVQTNNGDTSEDIDVNLFFPQLHDSRKIFVDNKVFERFITENINQPPLMVKKLLFESNLIIKSKDGRRYTQNKGASSIPCVCFYAEPLHLDDRNEHLSLG